jgi:tetratricopeptide (TPR) repeat protein
VTINPPQLIVAEVEALLERRRTAQAKARLAEGLRHYPNHPDLLLQLGWADYMAGNNAAALATVRQVLAQDVESQSARLLLFELQLAGGDLGNAEHVIVHLLRDYPEHAPYYGRYAELLIRAILLPKARALAEEGLKYAPDDAGCLAARATCDFIEQRSGATSHSLQQLLVRHPQSIRTLALVLVALQDRGNHREALRIAQELVRAQPDNDEFARIAAELTATTHWSMLPLWPMLRWGWAASIALWLVVSASIRILGKSHPDAALVLAMCFLAYVIYSWVWPYFLRRRMTRGLRLRNST